MTKFRLFLALFVLFAASCQLDQASDSETSLTASFTYLPATPVVHQPVQFTDTSAGSPVSWQWDFGDGGTSAEQNPEHTYDNTGTYSVILTVADDAKSNSVSRSLEVVAEGPSYYIDANNSQADDSNPGTEALPWKTVARANQTLVAGETVYIKTGSYSDYIAPRNSGIAAARITYKSYGSDEVTIRDASYGIRLNGKSYITIHGIDFYNLDRFMYLENGACHNVIAYCNFDQMRNRVEWAGSRIRGDSSHNRIHNCRFSKFGGCYGTPPDGNDSGVVLEIGSEESMTGADPAPDFSNYNLIENNILFHGGHHVLGVMGRFNVIRNNYLHNEGWSQERGNRTLYMNGYEVDTGWNLIEGNRFAYAAPPCDATIVSGVSVTSHDNIFRFNSFYFNNLAGLAFSVTRSYYQDSVRNHVYNNTFFRNSQTDEPDPGNAAVYFAVFSGTLVVKNNVFKNNLYYGHPKAYGVYRVSLDDQTFEAEFNGDVSGDPRFVNAGPGPGDPMNGEYPDFHLTGSSPCLDKGGALTTITSPAGSGSMFTVADAGYFMDGWEIEGVSGDLIRLVGTTQKARIIKVDYTARSVTVDQTLSWAQNQGIALAYSGAAPEAGAFEYTAGSTPGRSLSSALKASFLSRPGTFRDPWSP